MDLNTIWFLLVGTLLTGYLLLDGFDLGAGPLLLFVKNDRDRRVFLNAIGPIWNGNEVWLVTGGGALFAAFPEVYATAFSGFYDALMLLLMALIFRAAAIEFRSQRPEPRWRSAWDLAFAVASSVSAVLLGVAVGNVVWGIPLNDQREYLGGLEGLLRPYPLLVGVTSLALMVMHANLYLVMKAEGELELRLRRWARTTVPVFLACFVAVTAATLLGAEHLSRAIRDRWVYLGITGLAAVAFAGCILREVRRDNAGRAFIYSCLTIVSLNVMLGLTVFPNLLISRPGPQNSLTIYNGSSTQKTLDFMLYVAIIGVPFVLAYTASIYYVFRGKVVLTEESY